MQMIKKNNAAALLILLLSNFTYSQRMDDIKLQVDSNLDIRKTAAEYFGNPDLWPYILKYNNIKNLGDVKIGTNLLIPQAKVRRTLSRLDEANKSFQNAVQIGAKILAEDLLNKASSSFQQATKQKDSFEYDSVEKYADESIANSKAAYKQAKEIREKTIDAIISFKRGIVQKMFPSILKWEEAELYDNLKENDWARTLTLSNANITFYDLSQIKLNENSQAIIQSSKFDVIDNKTTTKVKLEKGDAYAMLLNSPKKRFDLDIKGVKTKINSKYFWVEKGNKNTKLSNYNGEIALEVKDSSVVVKKNQGSVIPDGGFPAAPKNLLAAPNLLLPADQSKIYEVNPMFNWTKNDKAESYWLEFSTDASFKKVYSSFKNIHSETMKLTSIDAGVYYWHVCSVDSTGLPGPYSESRIIIAKLDANNPFLFIEYPPNNLVTRQSKIVVKGKTDTECIVKVNETKIETDSVGNFRHESILADGKNILELEVTNKSGGKTKIYRNIFCELSSNIKVLEKTLGELVDQLKIATSKNVFRLILSTRPLSRIVIISKQRNWSTVNYSDTLGSCFLDLPIEKDGEDFLLSILTPASFEKSINFSLQKNNVFPRIIFELEPENETNRNVFVMKGKAENTNELQINNQKIALDANGYFSFNQLLRKSVNDFVIKAVGLDGRIATLEKRVVLDNQPPRLISCEIRIADKDESLYLISVKAHDETTLKNFIKIKFNDGGTIRKELINYSKEKNIYEGVFNCKAKPLIKSIVLEDYLGNVKNYEVDK
jgi:hypothetical protein